MSVNKAEHFERGRKAAEYDLAEHGVAYAQRMSGLFTYTEDDERDGGIAFANGYTRTIKAHIIANKEDN